MARFLMSPADEMSTAAATSHSPGAGRLYRNERRSNLTLPVRTRDVLFPGVERASQHPRALPAFRAHCRPFSRHASSGIATKQSKSCKSRICGVSVQFGTPRHRRTRGGPRPPQAGGPGSFQGHQLPNRLLLVGHRVIEPRDLPQGRVDSRAAPTPHPLDHGDHEKSPWHQKHTRRESLPLYTRGSPH